MLLSVSGLAKYLLNLAVMNLFSVTGTTMFLDIWTGITVQSAWVILLGITAVCVTIYCDVR